MALGLHEGVTRAEAISLYVEWLEANDARPIDGWRRWDMALRACGVTKRRSSLPGRPRLYYPPASIAAPTVAESARDSHLTQAMEKAA